MTHRDRFVACGRLAGGLTWGGLLGVCLVLAGCGWIVPDHGTTAAQPTKEAVSTPVEANFVVASTVAGLRSRTASLPDLILRAEDDPSLTLGVWRQCRVTILDVSTTQAKLSFYGWLYPSPEWHARINCRSNLPLPLVSLSYQTTSSTTLDFSTVGSPAEWCALPVGAPQGHAICKGQPMEVWAQLGTRTRNAAPPQAPIDLVTKVSIQNLAVLWTKCIPGEKHYQRDLTVPSDMPEVAALAPVTGGRQAMLTGSIELRNADSVLFATLGPPASGGTGPRVTLTDLAVPPNVRISLDASYTPARRPGDSAGGIVAVDWLDAQQGMLGRTVIPSTIPGGLGCSALQIAEFVNRSDATFAHAASVRISVRQVTWGVCP